MKMKFDWMTTLIVGMFVVVLAIVVPIVVLGMQRDQACTMAGGVPGRGVCFDHSAFKETP